MRGRNISTLSITTSNSNGTNQTQRPFDLVCQKLVDYDHPIKVGLFKFWDHCFSHTRQVVGNLFIWMRAPWANDSKSHNYFSYRNHTQVNRPMSGYWPLCGHHACMNVRPLLFILGGVYYSGTFKDKKTFETSVKITPKNKFHIQKHTGLCQPPFFPTNQCYYNKLKLHLKPLRVECLLEVW